MRICTVLSDPLLLAYEINFKISCTGLLEPVSRQRYKLACAPKERLRSACVFAQFSQSSMDVLWVAKDPIFDSDETSWMRILISLFDVRTYQLVYCWIPASLILFLHKNMCCWKILEVFLLRQFQ